MEDLLLTVLFFIGLRALLKVFFLAVSQHTHQISNPTYSSNNNKG